MITIFNRRELTSTYSMKVQGQLRDILAQNRIEYAIKVVNRISAMSFSPRSRTTTSRIGENPDFAYQYVVYVKKEDLEEASYLIRDIDINENN